jgi:hypothetical protein
MSTFLRSNGNMHSIPALLKHPFNRWKVAPIFLDIFIMANDASIQVGEGYTAFEGAHHDMDRISNASSQMPQLIRDIVLLITTGSPDEIRLYLNTQLEGVLRLASICQNAASHCEGVFENISGLAQVSSFRKIYSSSDLNFL